MATEEVARSLATKMQKFSATLGTDEQKALEELLETVASQMESTISKPRVAGERLLAPSGSDKVIGEILLASRKVSVEEEVFPTPTVSVATTVTVMASHPAIGCHLTE